MKLSARQSPATEVAFFRDPAATWFAAEVVRRPRWSDALLDPLDAEVADIRIAFLRDMPVPGLIEYPAWLRLLPESAEDEPRAVVETALAAWASSPAFRLPGPPPEAYVLAGYQAFCPPHPPCEPGPGMRETLMGFLLDRSGALGRVVHESEQGANRLFRRLWRGPSDFAQEILHARIREEGGRGVLDLVEFIEAAAIAGEASEHAALAQEREALLARLPAVAYFTDPLDYDRAAALALDWRERYHRAYRLHYRAVLAAAHEIIVDTAEAARLLPDLDAMNASGRPIGQDAARRLRSALGRLVALPEGVDAQAAQTAGIVLGQMPHEIGEARLAAAAILAAVEVHRRRSAATRPLLPVN